MNNLHYNRNRIDRNHPVFEGRRKLSDEDVLQPGDETACVSCLLTMDGDSWVPAEQEYHGLTVRAACDDPLTPGGDDTDMDGKDRVFRRRQ